MKNMYELMVLLKPLLPDDVRKAMHKSIVKLIEDSKDGKLVDVDVWGKRYLAYEVEGYTEGYYIVYVFEMDGSNVEELNRKLRLQQDCLRCLLVKVDGMEEVGIRVKKKKIE